MTSYACVIKYGDQRILRTLLAVVSPGGKSRLCMNVKKFLSPDKLTAVGVTLCI